MRQSDFGRLLACCPRCRMPCLLTVGDASYRNLALFEARPWRPEDEPVPEGLTPAARRTRLRRLPHALAVAHIDFARASWRLAVPRAADYPERGQAMWKPHRCWEDEDDG